MESWIFLFLLQIIEKCCIQQWIRMCSRVGYLLGIMIAHYLQ